MLRQSGTTGEKRPNARRPYAKRDKIILGDQIYKIMYGVTRIPIRAGQHTHIRLMSYAREQLESAKPDSITGW